MPKEKKAPSLSSDRSTASPYRCSSKTTKHNIPKNHVKSVGEEKEWEQTKCPICMEPPHNAVLLLCSSNKKGCHPYMCNTSNLHSNCLEQFRKLRVSTPMLLCPLCRGQINECVMVEPARKFMNSIPRSCSVETCEISGTCAELEKHASIEHPSVKPSEADPVRQHRWMMLERERDFQDMDFIVLDGNSDAFLEEELDSSWHMNTNVLFRASNSFEMSLPSDASRVGTRNVSNSSGVGKQPRRTTRMSVGNLPKHQLASRSTEDREH